MTKKITVGILFGGKSAEHEVSIRSAKNVYNALKSSYSVIPIGIDKKGNWFTGNEPMLNEAIIEEKEKYESVALIRKNKKCILFSLRTNKELEAIDVVFPVLHGPFGEDGSVQGLLKVLGVPFVGPGVLGSAIGMDKEVAKRLFREAGIPTAKFMAFSFGKTPIFSEIKKQLGLPVFIKPANLGSSVGVSKVKTEKEFTQAIHDAFRFDNKILIEEFIAGREIECSVLGNKHPKASIVGEIIPTHEFYDYEAKYIDENGAKLMIPADISPRTLESIQLIACKVFQVLCLEGMARVDFFLTKDKELYVNEVNTIPGFTNISMYPKLWKASGMEPQALINTLVTLAIERFKREEKLQQTR